MKNFEVWVVIGGVKRRLVVFCTAFSILVTLPSEWKAGISYVEVCYDLAGELKVEFFEPEDCPNSFFFQINKLILFDWLQNKFSIIWKVFDKGQVCNSYRNRKSCVWKMNDWKSKVVLKYWNQNVTQIQFGRPPSGLSQSEYVKVQQICLEWLF